MISIVIAILLLCTIFPLCIFLRITFKKKLTESYLDNLNLLQAIKKYKKDQNDENSRNLTYALTSATYFALIDADNLNTEHVIENDYIDKKEGSNIKLHFISDVDGNVFLPIFTDMNHIKTFTTDTVNRLIFPAKELFSFFKKIENNYSGIVINPGEEEFILEKENIDMLWTTIKSDECLDEVLNLVESKFRGNDGSIKIEDFILAMGNLTGYFIYKVMEEHNKSKISELDLKPGTVFLIEDANKLCQDAFARIQGLLEWYGFDFNRIEVEENIYKSNITYLGMMEDIQGPVTEIFNKYEFFNLKAIDVCAVGTSVSLNHFHKTLPINKSLGIAFYGIIEGSKTVPVSL